MALETFTAVGLVGNIIQFIDFSSKLLALSSDIRKSTGGYVSRFADIEAIAKDVETHTQALKHTGSCHDRPQELIDKVLRVAREILSTLNSIRKKRPGGHKWNSFRQALEYVWNEDKIEKFQDRLESLRSELQHHLVVEIW
jgi:hypothetical protein